MRKGLKKFTVPYQGTYFDGGKVIGQKVVFAENEEKATKKVQKTFTNEDEPIIYVHKAIKWTKEDMTEEEVFPYWGY